MRRRVGRAVALAYLACVIVPPISLTFADPAVAAHCLTEDHHGTATAHVHADVTDHVHGVSDSDASPHHHATHVSDPAASPDTGKSADGKCCGLFCFSAAVADVSLPDTVALRASVLQPALEPATAGRDPDPIHPPPIPLASL